MKVILYMAVTPNGMIAGPNGETPWSSAVWKTYAKNLKKIGAIIVGHNTFEIMHAVQEFELIGNPLSVVISRKKIKLPNNFICATTPREALAIVKENGFGTVVIGGGAKTATTFLKENLVDEIWLDVEPILFGVGIPILEKIKLKKQLQLTSVKKLSTNTIQLHYRVKK